MSTHVLFGIDRIPLLQATPPPPLDFANPFIILVLVLGAIIVVGLIFVRKR